LTKTLLGDDRMRKERGNSTLIAVAVIVGIVVLVGLMYVSIYNSLIHTDESVKAEWAEVQNQYQRRFDLLPPLVNSTKMYINYEQKILTEIAEMRSAWTQSLNQPVEQQMDTMNQFDSVMNRLLAIVSVENYPDLKADGVVMSLMDQVEGTENRIAVARGRYIDAVKNYNNAVRGFFSGMVARNMGLELRPTFAAVYGAEEGIKIPIG